jgi:hypothetical protein
MLLTLILVMLALWLFDITAFSVAQDWRQFFDRRHTIAVERPGFN